MHIYIGYIQSIHIGPTIEHRAASNVAVYFNKRLASKVLNVIGERCSKAFTGAKIIRVGGRKWRHGCRRWLRCDASFRCLPPSLLAFHVAYYKQIMLIHLVQLCQIYDKNYLHNLSHLYTTYNPSTVPRRARGCRGFISSGNNITHFSLLKMQTRFTAKNPIIYFLLEMSQQFII